MKKKIVITIVLVILIANILILKMSNNFNKKLNTYTKENILNYLSNESELILKKSILNSNIQDLILVTKNKNDEIIMIDFNDKVVNQTLMKGINILTNSLTNIEKGNLTNPKGNPFDIKKNIFWVSIGSLTNNVFLENIGPKLPLKLKMIGSIQSNANIKATDYGINNVKIDVNLIFYVRERVMLPLISDEVTIKIVLPISSKLIQGKVPSLYGDVIEKNSKIYN